jgi:hypothetical protein
MLVCTNCTRHTYRYIHIGMPSHCAQPCAHIKECARSHKRTGTREHTYKHTIEISGFCHNLNNQKSQVFEDEKSLNPSMCHSLRVPLTNRYIVVGVVFGPFLYRNHCRELNLRPVEMILAPAQEKNIGCPSKSDDFVFTATYCYYTTHEAHGKKRLETK